MQAALETAPARPAGAPVAPEERVAALDALRGFALLGILLVNILIFANGFWHARPPRERYPGMLDQAALYLNSIFIVGKANALFSFLFGLGFAMQLRRLGDGRSRGLSVYLRRLAVLFAFGMAHAVLIWSGDVLHHYALLGLLLLALRNVPRRWLYALIVVVFLVPQAVRVYRLSTTTPALQAEQKAHVVELEARSREAYAGDSYAGAVRMRLRDIKEHDASPLGTFDWLMTLSVTSLLGLHFGRERLVERAAERPEFWAKLQKWALFLGLGSGLLNAVIVRTLSSGRPSPLGLLTGLLFDLCRPTLMLFYAATVVRLSLRRPDAPWLGAVAAAGRMPLTNYVMQSVLCTFVFYGHGLGLYGKAAPPACFGIAAAVWAAQAAGSRAWASRFLYGPGEWLWRVLTYGRLLPLRRPASPAA